MPYRKHALRRMTPQARRLARLADDLESVRRKLKGLVPVVEDLELWERAERKRQAAFGRQREREEPPPTDGRRAGDG